MPSLDIHGKTHAGTSLLHLPAHLPACLLVCLVACLPAPQLLPSCSGMLPSFGANFCPNTVARHFCNAVRKKEQKRKRN